MCRNCGKAFKILNKHLSQKEACRILYTEDEIRAATTLRTSKRNKRYQSNNKEAKAISNAAYYKANQKKLVQKQKLYNLKNKKEIAPRKRIYYQKNKEKITQKQNVYNLKHQKKITQRQKVYNLKNQKSIVQKQRDYNKKNQENINRKQQVYREKYINKNKTRNQILDKMPWTEAACRQLLQYKPQYREFCGPETRREIIWMSPEQLADFIQYHIKLGYPPYSGVTIDYSFMSTSHEIPPWTNPENKIIQTKKGPMYVSLGGQPQLNPQNFEVGLSNSVLLPGDEFGFRGEEVTEDINIIVKLKTMPSQPEVEKVTKITDWPIDHSHLIQTLMFWKRKDHLSLRGIRFQTGVQIIPDWENTSKWSSSQRKENEEKVVKSWKYFETKPYHLLAYFHKDKVEERGESYSDGEEDWMEAAGKELMQEIPSYKKFCGNKTRREVKFIDPEQLVDFINCYKREGFPGYEGVEMEYKFMKSIHEFNPDYSEVGLCNSVILPGKGEYSLFDGKEVTEDLNVILKLRTMPSQPEVDMDANEDSYWWIDKEHLIQSVRFWKKRNLLCLRGIRFTDIPDKDGEGWSVGKKWENEEKVTNNWKHLMTKPYNLMSKYHKSLLEEFGIIGEDEDGIYVFECKKKQKEFKYENFVLAYSNKKPMNGKELREQFG